MEYPYGHSHHNRRDEDDYPPPPRDPYRNDGPPPPHIRPDPYNSPPPPYDPYHHSNAAPPPPHVRPGSDPYYNQPPPPQVVHTSHGGGDQYPSYPPPPRHEVHHSPGVEAYPPAPHRNEPYSSGGSNVHHVSHESYENKPHGPSSIHNQTNHVSDYLTRKPSVRVYPKIDTKLALTIREGKVTLARADPSDPCQHWIKDEKYSTKVKDEQGFPSFALVNKATGQAIKHSIGASHPVQLIPYVPDKLDESVLWTFSVDLGDGYRTIRMVNNIRLNVDAFKNSNGRVHDGTTIGLWEWTKADNQRWIVVPY